MHLREWLDRLAPDLIATLRRFPFTSLLLLCTTAAILAMLNEFVSISDEFSWRVIGGLATGAVFATAGVLFHESRPEARIAGLLLGYVVPLAAIALFQVTDADWFVPWALPVISILWLSVSAFTRRDTPLETEQQRFWWLNHQAAATALIAAVAFLLIALGLAAIERSLSILFGLESQDFFYRWVLPVIAFLFTPLYWLATIPRLDAFDPQSLRQPDLIARATGFLGQFVLTPLLLAYALILLAYTLQIIVTQSLPQGMLGWMVLGFVTTGAATWLLLYPPFMRERLLVRIFRRAWFWLTVIPLLLYAVAVGVRIGAYGLTPDRMMLVMGGIWAGLLTLLFLLRRGDIRFIPGLAGAILLLFSFGPWNFERLPISSQAAVLDALLTKGGVTGPNAKPDWTPEEGARATSAMSYLFYSPAGERDLQRILAAHGVTYTPSGRGLDQLLEEIGADTAPDAAPGYINAARDPAQFIDIAATPYLVGRVATYVAGNPELAGLAFKLEAQTLTVSSATGGSTAIDLISWLGRNDREVLVDPVIDFTLGSARYRYVIEMATLAPNADGSRNVTYLDGTLFADTRPAN
ncbi:DUF4153 domain-containing protein [Paradevosia shaoguanensis]|uniref:DUF4153 domain-containing protein n=1 Tax=Paradevosia shaoguanensis TaxID=1335043 RepID=UPI00193425EC|nr:DUF4153 domain-containing protein [Paradevosia shaoguanensis]